MNDPSAELKYIPYYSQPVGINSFIGIPILHENNVTAILAADSSVPSAFDDKSIYAFLGYFTKILSAQINSANSNINKENADKTLNLINALSNIIMHRGGSFNDICTAITALIIELYPCSNIGVIVYNEQKRD